MKTKNCFLMRWPRKINRKVLWGFLKIYKKNWWAVLVNADALFSCWKWQQTQSHTKQFHLDRKRLLGAPSAPRAERTLAFISSGADRQRHWGRVQRGWAPQIWKSNVGKQDSECWWLQCTWCWAWLPSPLRSSVWGPWSPDPSGWFALQTANHSTQNQRLCTLHQLPRSSHRSLLQPDTPEIATCATPVLCSELCLIISNYHRTKLNTPIIILHYLDSQLHLPQRLFLFNLIFLPFSLPFSIPLLQTPHKSTLHKCITIQKYLFIKPVNFPNCPIPIIFLCAFTTPPQQFQKPGEEKTHCWNKTKQFLPLIKFPCSQTAFCREIKLVLNAKVI